MSRGLRSIGIKKIIPAQIDWSKIPSGSVNNNIRILGLADDNTSSYFTVFRSIKTPNGIVTSNGDGNFNVENVTIKNNVKNDGNYMYRTGVEMTLTSSLWFNENQNQLLGSGSVVLDPPRVFITSNELNNGSYNEPRLLFRRNKSPTDVSQAQELSLGSIIWFTDDRSSAADVAKFHARIEAQAHADWKNTPSNSYPTNLYFYTTPSGSGTSDIRMTVAHDGNVGIGTITPDEKLDVAGRIAISAESSSPTVAAGVGVIYTKTDGKLYFKSGDVAETDLTAGGASGDIEGVTAGNGLTGGGTTGTVTLTVGEGTGITVASTTVSTNDSEIVHDNLSGFVANEHIDHSGVSITAGDGLTGGGTIASTRTLTVGAGTGITVNANDVAFDPDGGTLSTANADVDHILINDGGVFKRIAPSNVNLSSFNNDLASGGGLGTTGVDLTGGTGIDISSETNTGGGDYSSTISVDVSDFMANGSNNRIVTATGTDGQNAEEKLTFDGTILHVANTSAQIGVGPNAGTPANTVQINHAAADSDQGILIVRDDATTTTNDLLGAIGFDSSDGNIPSSILEAAAYIAAYASQNHSATEKGGYLAFGTGPTDTNDDTVSSERMRITAAGYVGINTTNPQYTLDVSQATSAARYGKFAYDVTIGDSLDPITGIPALKIQQVQDTANTDDSQKSQIQFLDHGGNYLALLHASHKGTANDAKGRLVFFINSSAGSIPTNDAFPNMVLTEDGLSVGGAGLAADPTYSLEVNGNSGESISAYIKGHMQIDQKTQGADADTDTLFKFHEDTAGDGDAVFEMKSNNSTKIKLDAGGTSNFTNDNAEITLLNSALYMAKFDGTTNHDANRGIEIAGNGAGSASPIIFLKLNPDGASLPNSHWIWAQCEGGTSADTHINIDSKNDVIIRTGGSPIAGGSGAKAITCKADQKVGIKTNFPSGSFQVNHTGVDGDNGILVIKDGTVSDTNILGGIGFDSTDGNQPSSVLEASAYIAALAAEAHSTSDKGGDLVFGTAPINQDDDTTSTERMRILSDGKVGIGTTTPRHTLDVPDMGGLILSYVALYKTTTQTKTLTTSFTQIASTDQTAVITFTAPQSGNIELQLSTFVETNNFAWVYFSYHTSTTYSATGGRELTAFQSDESDDIAVNLSWVITGLTPGTSYTYYIFGKYSTSSGTPTVTVKWGGNQTGSSTSAGAKQPLIIRAVSLPSTIVQDN